MEVEDEWVCSDYWEHDLEAQVEAGEEEEIVDSKGGGGRGGGEEKSCETRHLGKKIPPDATKTSKGGLDRKKSDSQNRVDSSVSNGTKSSPGKRRGGSSSKPQDRSYNAKDAKGAKGAKGSIGNTKKSEDGTRSLGEKYPWNAVDCPIDGKMTRRRNGLLDEKYPWNSIDCFGDDIKKKKTETSKSVDEIYPWIGVECSTTDDSGPKKQEHSKSLDEKYPWNSIDCSDGSPNRNRKDQLIEEKYPWNSIECCNDASTSQMYNCTTCSKMFPMQSELIGHMKSEHADISLLDCSFCMESFLRRAELNDHMDTVHKTEDTYCCYLCRDASYKDAVSLRFHMRDQHHVSKKQVHKWYLQGGIRSFRVREAHLTDELRALQESNNWYDLGCDVGMSSCAFCKGEKSFESKDELNDHIDEMHTDEDNLTCPLCDHTFMIVAKLTHHLKERHSVGPEMVYMDFLADGWRTLRVKESYSYTVKRNSKLKNQGNDALVKPPEGLTNDKERNVLATDESYADNPIKRNVESDKSEADAAVKKGYVCRYCPGKETFRTKIQLKKHYRSAHDNNSMKQASQRFKCSICGDVYREMNLVKRHMGSLHHLEYSKLVLSDELSPDGSYTVEVVDRSKDVPYTCVVCKEEFISKSELRTHTSFCTESKKTSQWGVFF